MNNNKGFILLEIIIALAVFILILPIIFTSFLNLENKCFKTIDIIQKNDETAFLTNFITNDLKQAVSLILINNGFYFYNQANEKITYILENNKIKRKYNNNTLILNNTVKINSFNTEKNNAIIILRIASDFKNNQLNIFLPNGK